MFSDTGFGKLLAGTCLEMHVVGGRRAAEGTVVEDEVEVEGGGEVEHVGKVRSDLLRCMLTKDDGEVPAENGERIDEELEALVEG